MNRFLLLFVLTFTHSLLFAQINLKFSYDKALGCGPLTVSFRDNSTSPAGVMMRRWTFGDGNSSREKNPVHVYQQKGRYQVTLEVTDSAGNVASSVSMPPTYIVVLPLLDIGSQYLVCTQSDPDGKVTLLNKAVYPYDTASSLRRYTWSTGDTSASINVGPGRYTVSYEACGQTLVDSAAVFASADTTGLRILKVGNWDYGNISLDLGVTIPFDRSTLSKITIDWGDGTQSSYTDSYTLLNGNSFRRWYKKPGAYRITFTTSFKEPGQYCDTLQEITGIVREPYVKVDFGNDTTMAEGDTLVLDAGNPGATYWWSTGETTQSIKVTTSGHYQIFMMKNGDNGGDSLWVTFKSRDSILVSRVGVDSIRCLQVAFRDSSFAPYPLTSRQWDFGDGTTDTAANPLHTYTADGAYTVKLKVVSSNGDSAVSIRSISLNTTPVADLGPDRTLNPGDSLLLDAGQSGKGPDVSYVWSTGAPGATLTITTPGTYWVQASRCGNTVSDTIRVLPSGTNLSAGFSHLTTACNTIQFKDTSKVAFGYTARWHWDFGDNTADTLQHPAHVYTGPGNYSVVFTVWDNYGQSDTDTAIVTINAPLTVNLGPDSAYWSGRAVLGQNIPGGRQYQYQWSTGDTTRTITVTQDGIYSVKVTDHFCDTTAADTIQLGILAADTLVARIGTNSVHCNQVAFRDSSIAKPAIVKWEWNFGDGTTDTLQNPLHAYSNNGQYTVRLKVTNVNGLTDSSTRSLSLFFKPVVNLGRDTTLLPQDSLLLDATKPEGSPWASFEWSTGDTTPVIKAAAPGTYRVVVNYCGNTAIDTIYLSVKDTVTYTGLKARFNVVKTDCSTLQFNESSEVFVGHITRWQWNFGDNTSDTAQHPLPHTYSKPGSYVIKLTVTDSYGNKDSAQEYISLMLPLFVEFGRDTLYWNAPGELGYNMPQGPDYKYLWSTGDTTMFISVAQSGKYWVKVTDRYCDTTASDTVQIIITRTGTLIPHIGIDSIRNNLVAFRDSSVAIPGVIKWEWNFGDGTTDTLKNPLHTYASGGQYTVMLKVTNGYGHTDSTTRTLSIALPVADIGTVTTVNSNELLTVGAQFNHAFNSNNLFTVQLLRETSTGGRITEEGEVFDIAVIPGTNANVALSVKIPDTIPCSNDYRVRVISSAPADTVEWSSKFEIVNMPVATIQQRGDSLFTGKALARQWYLDNAALSGAIMPYYRARANGRYHVVLNNGGTCRSTSLPVNVSITAVPDVNAVVAAVKAFPNPSSGLVYIRFEKPLLKPVTLTVYDTRSNQVYSKQVTDQADQIDLSVLPKGVYYLEITGYEKQRAMRIILQ